MIRLAALTGSLLLAGPSAAHDSYASDPLTLFSMGLESPLSDPRIAIALLAVALALAIDPPEILARRLPLLLLAIVGGVVGAPLVPAPAALMLAIAAVLAGMMAARPESLTTLRLALIVLCSWLAAATSLQGFVGGDHGVAYTVGIGLGLMLPIAIPAILIGSLARAVNRSVGLIALRVAASWIAAIAAMFLAVKA